MSTVPASGGSASPVSPQLKAEARHHVDAVMPQVLAGEAAEHAAEEAAAARARGKKKAAAEAAATAEQELTEEPEIVELPLSLVVTDAASLTAEVSRLVPLLTSLHAAPWAVRVSSLKRVASLQRDPIAAACASFADEMVRLRGGLVEQLTDRRSQVVKQACDSITAMSGRFRDTFLHGSPSDERVIHSQTQWLSLVTHFIDALLPLIPITVQVIHAAACLCLNTIVKHAAPVWREGNCEYPIIMHLLNTGITHKHGIVRDHCYRGIANSIIRLDARYIKREDALDELVIAELDAAAAANVRKVDDEPDEASSPVASPARPSSSSGSSLYNRLESALVSGITDSFDKTRAAARLALIQFSTIAPARAGRVVSRMTAAQQKIYAQQRTEWQVNKIASSTSSPRSVDSSPIGSTNPSDEELEAEVNPAPKAKGKAKTTAQPAPAAAAATAVAGGKKTSGVAALRKKALKGKKAGQKKGSTSSASSSANGSEEEDADVVSVVTAKMKDTKISMAKGKAAAAAAKSSEEDEADSESTPVKGGKAKRKAATASDEDGGDEEEDDEDEHPKPADTSLLSPNSASIATAAQQARNFTLLAKLLDLENPMLTEKMTSFLLHQGVLDVFTAFITRMPEDVDVSPETLERVEKFEDVGARYHNVYEEGETPGEEYSDLPLVHRARPNPDNTAEQTAVRRSFHVMQILCGQRQSASLMAILMPKLPTIVQKLLSVFHPRSAGNHFHACAVMHKFLTVYPDLVLQAVCAPAGRVLFTLLFDHLHEPPVAPLVLALFQAAVDRKVRTREMSHQSDILSVFVESGILSKKITPRIVDCPPVSRLVSQASAEFVLQLVEKILSEQTESAASDLGRLLAEISQEGNLVAQLTDALTHPGSREPWQLANIGSVLNSLLSATSSPDTTVTDTDVNAMAMAQMMGNAVSLQKKITNAMHAMKTGVYAAVADRLGDLTRQLIAGETPSSSTDSAAASTSSASSSTASTTTSIVPPVVLSSYTVSQPFTSARVQLFKLLVQLVKSDIDSVLAEVESIGQKRTRQPHGVYPNYAALFLAPRLFQQVPQDTWRVLVGWFFRYIHNNFVLGAFRSLVLSILQLTVAASAYKEEERRLNNGASGGSGCCTDDTLRFLFGEVKLLERMIEFYTSPTAVSSCTGSYILELSNHIRLSSDLVTHQSFLYTYLQAHDRWQAFLPRLTEESLTQSTNLHVRPFEEENTNTERAALERALGFSLGNQGGSPPANPNAFITPAGYGAGVELGSVFAWHMGFKEKVPLGAAVSGGAKKKKKKAAKKKKKAASKEHKEGDDEGEHDAEETDDTEDAGSQSDSSASASASPIKKTPANSSTANGTAIAMSQFPADDTPSPTKR